MKAIQLLVLNLSLATFGLLTMGLTAATAQDAVNQSDTTGNAIEPPPIIDSGSIGGGSDPSYNPSTGAIDVPNIPGLDGGISIDPQTNSAIGDGAGTPTPDNPQVNAATGDGAGTTAYDNSQNDLVEGGKASNGETRSITLNTVAGLLADDLNESLQDLEAAESESTEPRRIVRRANGNCKDTSLEARAAVGKKLEQAREFIDRVEQIDPGDAIW
jgi:hypothetical protein